MKNPPPWWQLVLAIFTTILSKPLLLKELFLNVLMELWIYRVLCKLLFAWCLLAGGFHLLITGQVLLTSAYILLALTFRGLEIYNNCRVFPLAIGLPPVRPDEYE